MTDIPDANAAIWKSDGGIAYWVATAEDRERGRAEPRRLVADLLPFDDGDEITFVDLGAGTGAAARAILDRYSRAEAVLADFSPQMIAEGIRELAPYAGRYRYVELDLGSDAWPRDIPTELDAVVSSLCVHHLPDEGKRQLFGEVFAHLAPGGWYLNYDPVTAGDPVVEAAWERAGDRRDPSAAHARAHRTEEERLRYENHVRYMMPLAPQLDLLRSAGFEGVDAYWKRLGEVIYGGRRPSGSTGEP
ncbi:MAG TPA: class I SAM-dependent methyltransferase [Acidimicrobiales bacterium]|nr:class I SAM-dependent methyltransferase [Acidimicrobiales bacterium]